MRWLDFRFPIVYFVCWFCCCLLFGLGFVLFVIRCVTVRVVLELLLSYLHLVILGVIGR